MIQNFLNIRNSTRNLTDSAFDKLVPELAIELENVSFYSTYTQNELLSDWSKLKSWNASVTSMASTQRLGMKLCEHFFPNFYDIEDKKGNSFKSLWTAANLEKVLRWNRKCHSTPYLSEIKRGIYFNFGLPKSTMFRPQMAKMIVNNLTGTRVLDPCAGWGGRMLGSLSADVEMYTAFEPNTETYNGLCKLVKFLGVENRVTLYKDSALNMNNYDIQPVDIVLTSPPYFTLEVYSHEETQSITGCTSYKMWVDKFLNPLVNLSISKLNPSGWSCWNVHNVGNMKMIDDVASVHSMFTNKKLFSVTSSRRQTNQPESKNTKNSDWTVCYSNTTSQEIEKFF
jgi:16S rRNA G966 N2-methylase RsmD